MFQRFRNSVNKMVWKYYLWESFMTNNQVLIFAQVQQGAGNIPQTFWSMLTCQILTLVADFSSACPQWESFPPHPICALFDIWGLWRTFEYRELILSCDQDSHLRWFDVCIMLCYPARSRSKGDGKQQHCSGRLWCLNEPQCAHSYKGGWIHAFMLFGSTFWT